MELDLQPNKWEYKHTDCEGVEHIIRFEAETWPEALQNFIKFLRGSGYDVNNETIAINRTKHPLTRYVDSFNDYYEDSEDSVDTPMQQDLTWFKFGGNE